MSFVKLYGSIIHSSIWAEPNHVRIVWLTMLAMSTYQGVVEASVGGIAHAARVTDDECRHALEVLQSPDKDSRDGTTGERIRKVAGGWEIINHNRYRDMRSPRQVKQAEYQSRYRQRVSGAHGEQSEIREHHVVLTPSTSSSPSSSPSYSSDSEGHQQGNGTHTIVPPSEASEDGGATTIPPKPRSARSGAAKALPVPRPDDVALDLWDEWCAFRKSKRAPVTQRVLDDTRKKADEIGWSMDKALTHWISQGYAGFFPPAASAGTGTPKGGGYDSRGRWRGVDPLAKPSDYTPKNYDDPFGDLNP